MRLAVCAGFPACACDHLQYKRSLLLRVVSLNMLMLSAPKQVEPGCHNFHACAGSMHATLRLLYVTWRLLNPDWLKVKVAFASEQSCWDPGEGDTAAEAGEGGND